MKSLEIKGGLLELIANVNDVDILKKLQFVIVDFLKNNEEEGDFWEGITPEGREQIMKAYEESFDEANWVSSKEADKIIESWGNK